MARLTPRSTLLIITLSLLGGLYCSQAWAENTLDRHMDITNLDRASAPHFVGLQATLLFTFSTDELSQGPHYIDSTHGITIPVAVGARRVSIAFGHEGWAVQHILRKINNGNSEIFFLYYDIDREIRELIVSHGGILEYRLIVDGVWMADPLNPSNVRKLNGALISQVDLSQAPPEQIVSPEILPEKAVSMTTIMRAKPEQSAQIALAGKSRARTVYLRFSGDPGLSVYVGGTFNQFDPYLNPMEIEGPNPRNPDQVIYKAELRLLAGQYYYHFVINGKAVLDAFNVGHAYSPEGIRYSVLHIP